MEISLIFLIETEAFVIDLWKFLATEILDRKHEFLVQTGVVVQNDFLNLRISHLSTLARTSETNRSK